MSEIQSLTHPFDDQGGDRVGVHLLHIGKTGGTAVKQALAGIVTKRYRIVAHPHEFTIRDVPVGEKVVFFVRDPISRFVSGFYSRQRQGKPRYNVPWSPAEAVAFSRYSTPRELALGLAAPDATDRASAEQAMRSIQHVNSSYWDWFGDPENLATRIDDVIFVGAQEQLNEDFETLKNLLGVDQSVELPRDPTAAHCNPESLDRTLAEQAVATLARWYRSEYDFLTLVSLRFRTLPNYDPQFHRAV